MEPLDEFDVEREAEALGGTSPLPVVLEEVFKRNPVLDDVSFTVDLEVLPLSSAPCCVRFEGGAWIFKLGFDAFVVAFIFTSLCLLVGSGTFDEDSTLTK